MYSQVLRGWRYSGSIMHGYMLTQAGNERMMTLYCPRLLCWEREHSSATALGRRRTASPQRRGSVLCRVSFRFPMPAPARSQTGVFVGPAGSSTKQETKKRHLLTFLF